MIISHFHGDHINGLVDKDGKLAFAKAEILVPGGRSSNTSWTTAK